MPEEILGVCVPAAAPDTLDELRPLLGLKLARAAQHASASTSGNKYLAWLSQTLETMNRFQLARAFDSPLASYDLDAEHNGDSRAVSCVRHAVGLPDTTAKPLPLSAAATEFLLPHLRILVRTDLGPLAVTETHTTTQLVWTDGFTLTIPKCSLVDDWSCEDPYRHFRPIPEIHGFQILNDVPEVAALTASMELCERHDLTASMNTLARGLSFLQEVWPAAYLALVRQIKGIVLLQPRDHTRSHSPREFLGVIALTAGDDVSVGDLLVHEASHVRLELMRQFDPLWEDREPEKLHDSPWRPDARPLWGLILGVHAFLNVARYYQRVSKWSGGNERADALFERQKAKVTDAWQRAKEFVRPTPLGEQFFAELEREVLSL